MKMELLTNIPLIGLLFLSFCVSFSRQVVPNWGNMPANTQKVNESTPVTTTIFTVQATDYEGETITYHMTCNPSSGAITYFIMDVTTGAITVNSELDYEQMPSSFSCVVSAMAGGETITENLAINIIDLPEIPAFDSPDGYGIVFDDGLTAGTYLADPQITGTDDDAGDTIHCAMNCEPAGQGRFTMVRDTCRVYLTLDYSTDFGDPSTVDCNITLSDSTGNDSPTTAPLTFTVMDKNNFPPVFTQPSYNFDMTYYAPVATTLAPTGPSIEATDSDLGKYGIVKYSLDQSSLTSEIFRIDSSTGALSTIRLLTDVCINCTGATLTFDVIATDVGGSSTTATVTVNVDSMTTTVGTTQSLRYLTCFEDSDCVLWVTVAILLGLIVLCVGTFIIFKYCCRCARNSYSDLRPDYEPRQERFDNYNKAKHTYNRTTRRTPI